MDTVEGKVNFSSFHPTGDSTSEPTPSWEDIIEDIKSNNSVSIHLRQDKFLADENHKLNPLSSYAKSKVDAENRILSFNGNSKMNPTILRFARP